MTELVNVSQAARALGLSKSTVSRYLGGYPELNRGTDKRPLVDLEELRRHRADNVHLEFNPAGRSGPVGAGRVSDEVAESPALVAAPADPPADAPTAPARPGATYNDARAEREAVAAQRARIELDEKLGKLVPTSEVEDGAAQAAATVQTGMMRCARELPERLAHMTDPAEIRDTLETEFRRVLGQLATDLEKLCGDGGQDVAA